MCNWVEISTLKFVNFIVGIPVEYYKIAVRFYKDLEVSGITITVKDNSLLK